MAVVGAHARTLAAQLDLAQPMLLNGAQGLNDHRR